MPHIKLYRYLPLLILTLCAGCSDHSAQIVNQLNANGMESINLAEVLPSGWNKVCFIGPYSDNAMAERTLGFAWPVETRTSIQHNDGISLIIFVKNKSVIEYIEHPRDKGDFADLSGSCFSPRHATFKRVKGLPDNWPRLVPADEA